MIVVAREFLTRATHNSCDTQCQYFVSIFDSEYVAQLNNWTAVWLLVLCVHELTLNLTIKRNNLISKILNFNVLVIRIFKINMKEVFFLYRKENLISNILQLFTSHVVYHAMRWLYTVVSLFQWLSFNNFTHDAIIVRSNQLSESKAQRAQNSQSKARQQEVRSKSSTL